MYLDTFCCVMISQVGRFYMPVMVTFKIFQECGVLFHINTYTFVCWYCMPQCYSWWCPTMCQVFHDDEPWRISETSSVFMSNPLIVSTFCIYSIAPLHLRNPFIVLSEDAASWAWRSNVMSQWSIQHLEPLHRITGRYTVATDIGSCSMNMKREKS